MLLKALIRHVVHYVKTHPDEHGSRCLLLGAEAIHMSLEEMLTHVKPQGVYILRDFVPLAFPKKLRQGDLRISKNILGAWRVEPE